MDRAGYESSNRFNSLNEIWMIEVWCFPIINKVYDFKYEQNENFCKQIIISYLTMLGFQIFQNISMTIQLLPITDLPLPYTLYLECLSGIIMIIVHTDKIYFIKGDTTC